MLSVSHVMDGWWQIRHTKVLMDMRVHQVAEMAQSLSELLRKPVRGQAGPNGGGNQGWGGGLAMATSVCFKLLDAVSDNQEWNALERGFLCSPFPGWDFWGWKRLISSPWDRGDLGCARSSGLSHLFPRADRELCCMLGPRMSAPFKGSQWNPDPSCSSA